MSNKVGSLEVVNYHYDGKDIVITKIKVKDTNGKYIKFARLKDVINHLHLYPITFKKNEERI